MAACDALVSVENAQNENETGTITVQITDLTHTHNVLIWTPSGDIPADEVSEGIWVMEDLVPSDMYKAMVFAYDNNGNEICEIHYAAPISVIEEGDPVDICVCPQGILDNFSFENGTASWQVSDDDDFFSTYGHEACASSYGLLDWDNGPDALVYQQVDNINPGSVFDLEFYGGTHLTSFDHWVRLAFYDESDNLLTYTQIDINHDVGNYNGDLLLYTENEIEAPVSTSYLRLEGYASGNFLKLDAVCLMMEMPTGSISGSILKNQQEVDDFGNVQTVTIAETNTFVMLTEDTGTAYSTLTDASGNYEFLNIPVGNYILTAPEASLGCIDFSDYDSSDDGDPSDLNDPIDNNIPVSLGNNELDADNDFVDVVQAGMISGTVLLDLDNDDVPDDAFSGVELNLYDPNGQIAKDKDGNNVASVVTDNIGNYSFSNLAIGNYVVKESQPLGYGDVSDGDSSPDGDISDSVLDNDNQIAVSLTAAEIDADNNFIDEPTSMISGNVTEDIDNDNIGDLAMASVEMQLTDPFGDPVLDKDGNIVTNILTDSEGYFEFNNLIPGQFYVKQIQPTNYEVIWGEDFSDDDAVDLLDYELVDNIIPVHLESIECDKDNDLVNKLACQPSEPNTYLAAGVVTNPGIVGSETDIVNVTFVLVNLGNEPLTEVELDTEVTLVSGTYTGLDLIPIFAGDPNNNGVLDPNEIWFYSAVSTFDFGLGDSFIVSVGSSAQRSCATEIGGGADLLFTSGVNMDVKIEQESIKPGETIDISLTTRLLIDEDVAQTPGTTMVMVKDVPIEIELRKSKWNARDLRISATGLNNGIAFDPFNPPNGVELLTFCDQGGLDAGTTDGYILDESEPIETVRAPCANFGDDDKRCEFPDWVFCYQMKIPDDFNGSHFTVTATDDFTMWMANEIEAGTEVYEDFIEITDAVESSGADSDAVKIEQIIHAFESIELNKINNTTELTWTVSHEKSDTQFNIERSSDGINFITIGEVNGNGTTLILNNYLFTDTNPRPHRNFYRVVQVDPDGVKTYSESRYVDFDMTLNSDRISIYPNPVTDFAVIYSESSTDILNVIIYNVDGTELVDTFVNSGEELKLSEFAPGQYYVKVLDQTKRQISYNKITVIR